MPDVDWKGIIRDRKAQQLVNQIVWEADFVQVVEKPTRESAILDIFLIRKRDIPVYCDIIPGISDHSAVVLGLSLNIDRKECESAERTNIWQYRKTNLTVLRQFLRDKYSEFEKLNGGMESSWEYFKSILDIAKIRFVPYRI